MLSDNLLLLINATSLIERLERVIVKFEHNISVYDYEIIKDKLIEIRFYNKALSISGNIPNSFKSFVRIAIVAILYKISLQLDKYSVEENELQIVVEELEQLRNQLTEDLENEKTEHTDCLNGSSSVYAYS
jgi:hypothetical protein